MGEPGRAVTALLLAAVLVAAALLRGRGLDWDEGTYLHPDERFLAFVQSSIEPPGSLREYLDTGGSPLNPNNRGHAFFVYGQLPVTLVRVLGGWLGAEQVTVDDRLFGFGLGARYDNAYRLGRAVSATSDVLTVLLTFLIGQTLYGRAAGLLAAALYAAAVAPIQQAHFATVDAFANLFITAAFWFAARAAQRARWSDDVLFGLALGAALASKISAAPVVGLLGLGVAARLAAQRAALPADAAVRQRRWQAALARAVISGGIAGIVALLTFRLLHPYAFVPPLAGIVRSPSADALTHLVDRVFDVTMPQINPAWTAQMAEVGRMMAGAYDQPPNHQWATRTPLLFPWLGMVRFGLGWPLGLAAWFAWAWALVQLLRRRPGAVRHLLPVAWVGVYFAWYGTQWVMKFGYFLAIYPTLAVLAAWGLLALWRGEPALGRPTTASRRRLGLAVLAVVLLGTTAWAWAFTRIYARPHPRLAATRWFTTNVPSDLSLVLDGDSGAMSVQVGLPNSWRPAGASDDDVLSAVELSRLDAGEEQALPLLLPRPGRLTAIRVHHIAAAPDGPPAQRLRLRLARSDDLTTLAACEFAGPFTAPGAPATCAVPPTRLDAGTPYELFLVADGGAVVLAGAIVATEGDWEDAVPVTLGVTDPWGSLYHGLALQTVWPDAPAKRERLQQVLDHADYLVISSNRLYDSLRRNPRRWPMTIALYRALFSGELGFALAADVASFPSLGPLWADDSAAEESFTVYDHPRVFVFRKTDAYRSAQTTAILARADLDAVEPLRADQVSDPPADLGLPPPRSATGGT